MSKPAFDSRHYLSAVAVGLLCAGAGLVLGSIIFPDTCLSVWSANPVLGLAIAASFAVPIAAAWRPAKALRCKRPLAIRVAGLQVAIFAAAVLQPAVTCSLETAYGAPGAVAGLLASWFAVLLFGYLYVGRYAEALRRQYDSRDEEAEV